MKNTSIISISLLFLLSAFQVRAAENSPIYLANQNPFVLIYGLPKSEAGFITPKGKLDAMFGYFVSNNAFSETASNGESMIWDGETASYNLRLRYGVGERLEVGLDMPYIQHR